MTGVTIRQYHPADLEPCRALWVELTQRHPFWAFLSILNAVLAYAE